MRQGPNNKRTRGRGNGRKGGNSRNSSFESNGPEVKVRGNAQQVVEKYLSLARDASATGDHINSESYYQFAEHYYRIMNANAANEQQRIAQGSTQDRDNSIPPNGSVADTEDTTQATDGLSAENGVNGRSRRRNGNNQKRENGKVEHVAVQSKIEQVSDPVSEVSDAVSEVSDPVSNKETGKKENSDPASA